MAISREPSFGVQTLNNQNRMINATSTGYVRF